MIGGGEIYSGIEGWKTGADRTGRVSVRFAINHWTPAIEAGRRQHPEVRHFEQCTSAFPWAILRPALHDGLLMASPSCKDDTPASQPSKKGTGGNGEVDIDKVLAERTVDRNTAWHVIEAAAAILPRVLLVENVVQFYRRHDFPAWRLALQGLGYEVREHTINAQDYGAAIDRPRAVITASRMGAIDLAAEWLPNGRTTMRDCLDLDDYQGNRWAPIDSKPAKTRELIRRKQRDSRMNVGILNNVGDGVRMRSLDDVAPSFTTQTGTQLMLVQGDRVRILNPLELTRMMGWFDREIQLALPTQRKLAAKLIGNAISPAMTEGVIRQALTPFD